MRETDDEAALLGRIAVRYGFITMEQLAEATRERGRGGKKLGAIMLEQGMLDELALGKVLTLQKRHRDALDKKKAAARAQHKRREKIPTPKDWAFDAPPQRSRQASLPRRARRTGDVIRDRIGSDTPLAEPKPSSARPQTAEDLSRRDRPTPPDWPQLRQVPDPTPEPPPTPSFQAEPDPVPEPAPTPSFQAERDLEVDLEPVELELDLEDEMRRRHTAPTLARTERPTIPPRPEAIDPPPRGESEAPRLPSEPAGPMSGKPSRVSLPPMPEAHLEPFPWDAHQSENPRVAFLIKLLTHAVNARASDVHVHGGVVARMRQLGQLVPITQTPLAAEATEEALTAILTPWQRRVFEEAGEIDFAYRVPGLSRFRANVYRQHHGVNGVFHIIPDTVPTLESLGLPQRLATLTNYTQGLVLITGPAGCGKTSTLAALTNIINEERTDHILTIEDPIEYVFQSKRCIVNQRQVGRHTESFATGLRGALREDPDIICIGELRDLETISLALSAAETGHLVLATLHTGSAIGTINRIVGAYPPGQQPQVRAMMSESLRAIASQRLLPGTDGNPHVALETLFITRAVGALIRDNKTFQIGSIMQTGRSQGMRLLDESLKELLGARVITERDALANCTDPRRLGGM